MPNDLQRDLSQKDEAPDTLNSRIHRCDFNHCGDDLGSNPLGSGFRRNRSANLCQTWQTNRCATIAHSRVQKLVQDVESDVDLEEWTGVKFDGLI
jgi:hypothetical protein